MATYSLGTSIKIQESLAIGNTVTGSVGFVQYFNATAGFAIKWFATGAVIPASVTIGVDVYSYVYGFSITNSP